MNDMSGTKRFWTLPTHGTFSFVLLPRFSLLALAGALEPLRHANHALGRNHYRWNLFSEGGKPVQSSSGIELNPSGGFDEVVLDGNVIIVGGADILASSSQVMTNWLRRIAIRAPLIGGLCTATRVLAEAGLLDGHNATIHWEMENSLREQFPDINVTGNLFEIDRNRLTCAGEAASTDMMLNLVTAAHGKDIAATVAAQVLHARVRSSVECQATLSVRTGTRNKNLLQAIALMERNIEDVLDIEDIAKTVDCSRRHLERLFSSKLGTAPMCYYRNMRLDRARQLLFETQMSHTEVAVACGFENNGSFSAAYKKRFGLSPTSEERVGSAAVVAKTKLVGQPTHN